MPGGKWGLVIPQRLLDVTVDGIVGNATMCKLNSADPSSFMITLYNARLAFIRKLIRIHPEQEKFEKGWMNRLHHFISIHV
jgi:lysozyme family protein